MIDVISLEIRSGFSFTTPLPKMTVGLFESLIAPNNFDFFSPTIGTKINALGDLIYINNGNQFSISYKKGTYIGLQNFLLSGGSFIIKKIVLNYQSLNISKIETPLGLQKYLPNGKISFQENFIPFKRKPNDIFDNKTIWVENLNIKIDKYTSLTYDVFYGSTIYMTFDVEFNF